MKLVAIAFVCAGMAMGCGSKKPAPLPTATATAPVRRRVIPPPRFTVAPTPTPAGPVAHFAASSEKGTPSCSSPALGIQLGPRVSEPNMQHTTVLVFTNHSGVACALTGYPDVSFVASTGRALRLVYRDSGDQLVTSRPAKTVILPPTAQAFASVNKNVCIGGDGATAASVDVSALSVNASVPLPYTGFVYADECTEAGDPGEVVHVSPFEPTFRDTLAH